MKPKKEFLRGRNSNCIECRRLYNRIYKQSHKREQGRSEAGIETWDQVDSVIREMAELQYGIQKEYVALEERIAILKRHTAEIIEPDLFHQINLRSILKAFLEKACPPGRAIRRKFDFGIVRLCRGKLNVVLDAARAGQRIGKP